MATPPFETSVAQNTGTSPVTVLSANSIQYLTVIGMSLSNKVNQPITANVAYNNGSTLTYLGVNIPIPVGSTFVPIGGEQKVVLTPGDSLEVTANTSTSMDTIVSYLNQVSS